MIIKEEPSLLSTTGKKLFCGCALVNLIMFYGVRWLELAHTLEYNWLAFVIFFSGLLFGLPGALGASIASFGYTLVVGYSVQESVILALMIFTMAYGGYRLWYSSHNAWQELFHHNSSDFLKATLLLAGFVLHYAIVYGLLDLTDHEPDTIMSFTFAIVEAFNIALLLGVPTFILWDKYAPVSYYPRPSCITAKLCNVPALISFLFAGELCTTVFYLCEIIPPNVGFILAAIFSVLGLCCAFVPVPELPAQRKRIGSISLSEDFILRLFGGCAIFAFLCQILIFYNIRYVRGFVAMEGEGVIRIDIFICILILLSAMSFILRDTHKILLQPLKRLSGRMADYLKKGTPVELETTSASKAATNELDLLDAALTKMHNDVARYVVDMRQAVAQEEKLKAQLNVAAAVQLSVLPKLRFLRPGLKNYKIAASMKPAKEVGGDGFAAFLLDEDHLALCISDVSGKGLPASLFMLMTDTILKEDARGLGPAATIEAVNTALAKRNKQKLFVTLWYGVVELSTGNCTYVNAGHNPPLLLRKGASEPEWLKDRSGLVLGLMPKRKYKSFSLKLEPGDKLFLYTDGFTEARNAEGKFFGEEALAKTLAANTEPMDMLYTVERFVGKAEQSDDLTFIYLERPCEEVSA